MSSLVESVSNADTSFTENRRTERRQSCRKGGDLPGRAGPIVLSVIFSEPTRGLFLSGSGPVDPGPVQSVSTHSPLRDDHLPCQFKRSRRSMKAETLTEAALLGPVPGSARPLIATTDFEISKTLP